MNNNWIMYLILIGLLLNSLFFTRRILPVYRRRAASKQWPVTPGKVLEKGISEMRGSRGGSAYYPWITYSYSVLGYEYSKTISMGIAGKRTAEHALETVGDTVDVRYNPQNLIENIIAEERVSTGEVVSAIINWIIFLFALITVMRIMI